MLLARAYMMFPEGRAKVLTLSYDDAVEQDIKLIEILNQYGIKAAFHINSGRYAPDGTVYPDGQIHRRMTKEAAYKLYKDSGHEVAAHTCAHEFLDSLPSLAVIDEILCDRLNLEEMFGGTVRGMSYPYGVLNDSVEEIMRVCGIAYSRTTVSTERFEMPENWLRLAATCHHGNPRLMELAEKFIGEPGNAKPKMFCLWGHSYEFEQKSNWNVIEDFCKYMGGRDDIWYATPIEIYEYTEAYKRLVWSANMSVVTNPSARDLWLRYAINGEHSRVVRVNAGETLKL